MTSRVLVSLRIEAPPERVFEAFTSEIGQWWRPNGLFQPSADAATTLVLEPQVGGRLLENRGDGEGVEIGEILVWEPPTRLVLTWRPTSFGPDERTEVHVRFEPVDDITRIVVEHIGWDRLPRAHVARHGFPLFVFQQRLAEWWRLLLGSLDEYSVAGGRSTESTVTDPAGRGDGSTPR